MNEIGTLYQRGILTKEDVLRLLSTLRESLSAYELEEYCHQQLIPDAILHSVQIKSEDLQTIAPQSLPEELATKATIITDISLQGSFAENEEDTFEKYKDLELIAQGGMGEVRRVYEHTFRRNLAMKIIHPHLMNHSLMVRKFQEEGQIIAQLQHPNIIPIHDMGILDDGRDYYTMKEVKGNHFGIYIAHVHHISSDGIWRETGDGWSFRRLISTFHQACLGVAHAHRYGVIHRDIKPENIMVEDNGTAVVMDWGLAKIVGEREDAISTHSKENNAYQTMVGQVLGTPAYMPPEQARGENDLLDYRSDVYSLGTILYEILIGVVPYTGDSVAEILSQVIEGVPKNSSSTPLREEYETLTFHSSANSLYSSASEPEMKRNIFPESTQHRLPPALVEICVCAMARDKEERYEDALAMADALQDWLDGSQRREQGLKVVQKALALDTRIATLQEEAKKRKETAKNILDNVPSWASEDEKKEGWKNEDAAQEFLMQARIHEVEKEQLLKASLSHKEDLEEAHLPLIEKYFHQHKEYEEAQNRQARKQVEIHLRYHCDALPKNHEMRAHITQYLKGDGALTLPLKDLSNVQIHRFKTHNRRFVRSKGKVPPCDSLVECPLSRGSYLLTARTHSGREIRYPIRINRLEHWNPIHPCTGQLKTLQSVDFAEDECFVPGGWFHCGGDTKALNVLPRKRVWIEDFVMLKYPVTNRDYLLFLNMLIKEGREKEALACVPRELTTKSKGEGAILYQRQADGLFSLPDDPQGMLWHLDYPVCMVSWNAASAYALWKQERTGVPWRLPTELEWEKAARGVDERIFVWGDFFDASWTRMRYTLEESPRPASVYEYPVDESVYGVRGLAGNMCEWTSSFFFDDGVPIVDGCPIPEQKQEESSKGRVRRGGSWYYDSRISRVAFRYPDFPDFRNQYISFRLVYSTSD